MFQFLFGLSSINKVRDSSSENGINGHPQLKSFELIALALSIIWFRIPKQENSVTVSPSRRAVLVVPTIGPSQRAACALGSLCSISKKCFHLGPVWCERSLWVPTVGPFELLSGLSFSESGFGECPNAGSFELIAWHRSYQVVIA